MSLMKTDGYILEILGHGYLVVVSKLLIGEIASF